MIARSRARVADFIGCGATIAVPTATFAPAVATHSERPGGLRLHGGEITEPGAAVGQSVGWPLVDSAGPREHGASVVERTAARDGRDAAHRRRGGGLSWRGAYLRERVGDVDEAVADRGECADESDEIADTFAAFGDAFELLAVALAPSGGPTALGGGILARRGGSLARRVVYRSRGYDRSFGRAATCGGELAASGPCGDTAPARAAVRRVGRAAR